MSSAKLSWIICFVINYLVFVVSTDHKRPGVRNFVTLKGLNYVRRIAVPIISKRLNHLKIPAISGSVDLYVGNLTYDFKKITLSQVKIPDSHISTLNKNALVVKGAHITFKINDLWSYAFTSWPYISDGGSSVISANGISLNVRIAIDNANPEKPSVDASHCDLNIEDLNVSFHGGASWLYNLFVLAVKDGLKDQLEKIICQVTVKAINKEVNAALKTIPDEQRILNQTIQCNYTIVNNSTVCHNGVKTDYKGECCNLNHPLKSPYVPEMLPPISDKHDKMLYIWITAYTINTYLFSYQQTGLLHTTVSSDNMPGDIPVKLNTNAFIFLIPPLYQKYPGRDMVINLNSTKSPQISFGRDQGYLTLNGTMKFNVILGDHLVDCFTLNVVAELKITSIFIDKIANSSYICCRVSDLRTKTSLLVSHIGEFNLVPLKFTVDVLSQFIVSRYVNAVAEKGFLLPVIQNLTLVDFEISREKDHVLISTDFRLLTDRQNITAR